MIHQNAQTIDPPIRRVAYVRESGCLTLQFAMDYFRGKTLIICAASIETRAIAEGFGVTPPEQDWVCVPVPKIGYLVQSGVGKANAAACIVLALMQYPDISKVINLGICGRLSIDNPEEDLGTVFCAAPSTYADEGVLTPEGFKSLHDLGFPILGTDYQPDATGKLYKICAQDESSWDWTDMLSSLLFLNDIKVTNAFPIATISTCSGTDDLARQIGERTEAGAEAMEGAAIRQICDRMSARRQRVELPDSHIAFAELRVVSNTTGDRDKQIWNMPLALERLREIAEVFRDKGCA